MSKKSILSLSLVLLLVLSLTNFDALGAMEAQPDEHNVYEHWFEPSFFINQEIALEFHQDILESLPQRRDGSHIYPRYYGGLFIDDDGNLVVNIVEAYGNAYDSHILGEALSNASVSSQQVQFSYSDLHSIMDYLFDYWNANPYCDIRNANVTNALCTISNRVVVGLYGYSEELKTAFRHTVIDSPMIVFEEALPRRHRRLLFEDMDYDPRT